MGRLVERIRCTQAAEFKDRQPGMIVRSRKCRSDGVASRSDIGSIEDVDLMSVAALGLLRSVNVFVSSSIRDCYCLGGR